MKTVLLGIQICTDITVTKFRLRLCHYLQEVIYFTNFAILTLKYHTDIDIIIIPEKLYYFYVYGY